MRAHRKITPTNCARCGIRAAALQVAGAFECMEPDSVALLGDLAPGFFMATEALALEAQGDDEHDTDPGL